MPICRTLEEMRALRRMGGGGDSAPFVPSPPLPGPPLDPGCGTCCAHAPYVCELYRLPAYWCRACLHRRLFPDLYGATAAPSVPPPPTCAYGVAPPCCPAVACAAPPPCAYRPSDECSLRGLAAAPLSSAPLSAAALPAPDLLFPAAAAAAAPSSAPVPDGARPPTPASGGNERPS